MTIGGVTIRMPSATVVSHDRKKSSPPPASSVAMAALTRLADSAATQKLPTERGTMKDGRPRSRRSISHSASALSHALATVKAADSQAEAPPSMLAAMLAAAMPAKAAGRERAGISSSIASRKPLGGHTAAILSAPLVAWSDRPARRK